MALWSVSLIDQFKASSGSSADNAEERSQVEGFKATMTLWERGLDKVKDKWMNKAWRSNHAGLTTHCSGGGRGEYLFKVHQSTTGVALLLGNCATPSGVSISVR